MELTVLIPVRTVGLTSDFCPPVIGGWREREITSVLSHWDVSDPSLNSGADLRGFQKTSTFIHLLS